MRRTFEGPAFDDCVELVAADLKLVDRVGDDRRLRAPAKVLERRTARLCCLASDCDVAMYKQLVKALCETNKIPMIEVEHAKQLGEWAGLCKLDAEVKTKVILQNVSVLAVGPDMDPLSAVRRNRPPVGKKSKLRTVNRVDQDQRAVAA